MTNIIFFKENGFIVGFKCIGHSGYADYGKDIVCASISAITQSVALGLTKVLNLKCKYKTNNNNGSLECWLPKIDDEIIFKNAQVLLNTALESLKDLQKGYPLNINVEVKN